MTCRGARHHACPSHIGRRDDDDAAMAAPRPPSLMRDDKAPSCPRPPVTFSLALTFIDESVTTWRCDPRPHPRRDDAAPITTAMGALSHSRMGISVSEKWLRPVLNGFEQLCLPSNYRGPFFAFLGRLHPITAQE